MTPATVKFTVERGDEEVELSISGNVGKFYPAQLYGAPENCYPSDGGEVDIDEVLLDGKAWAGELTESEREAAENKLFNKVQEDLSYDPDFDPE